MMVHYMRGSLTSVDIKERKQLAGFFGTSRLILLPSGRICVNILAILPPSPLPHPLSLLILSHCSIRIHLDKDIALLIKSYTFDVIVDD